MIPRFTPSIGRAELAALMRPGGAGDVAAFERACANTFGTREAVAYPYGRSALWALFKTLGLSQTEIIQPAYTCVVVAHATVLSGNIPRFVDIAPTGYNMDLDQVEAAMGPNTGAVIATHLFGVPLDLDRLDAIVAAAERRIGRPILVVQDCAHSFGARWNGRLVSEGRIGLFGLNLSKMLTSIFGGLLTVDDPALAGRLRAARATQFPAPGAWKHVRRAAYLLAAWAAFRRPLYALTWWLQERTPLLNRLTKAYHLDDQIRFPPDAWQAMAPVEARVGLAQLVRYASFVEARVAQARQYDQRLRGVPGLELPALVDGATWSHYPVRTRDRDGLIRRCGREGVQLGRVVDYSVPEMASYQAWRGTGGCPRSLDASRQVVNLPVAPGLSPADIDRVADVVARAAAAGPTLRD